MKKVYVHAYCRQNLGDDLFIKILVRRYPDVHFRINAPEEYRKAFLDEKNVSFPHTQRRKLFQSWLAEQLIATVCYSAYVKIGGSIFMEPHNWKVKKPYPQWLRKRMNRKKYVIGANFGPYYTPEFLEFARANLSNYAGVCFRDQYSYQLFENKKKIRYAPDVLFGYHLLSKPCRGKGVGISVVAMEKKMDVDQYAPIYYHTLAQVCDELIRDGVPVCLFAFCKAEGDVQAIQTILKQMDTPEKVEVCTYQGDSEAFLDRLNDCQQIIATRFHAIILGYLMQKPVFPIIYSPKQTHVLNDLNMKTGWNLYAGEMMTATAIVAECLDCSTISKEKIAQLEKDAQAQFYFLDNFLRKLY